MNNFNTYTLVESEKQEIISTIKTNLERHGEIVFAYIFGSFIDSEASFFRDIDIGVYIAENAAPAKQFTDYSIRLSLELESLIRRFPIDVIVINNAPLPLAFRITQGMLLLSRDEDLRVNFAAKTWSLYHDHAISSRYLLEEMLEP